MAFRSELFDEWWAAYPKKMGDKDITRNQYFNIILSVPHEDLMSALGAWKQYWRKDKTEDKYIPTPSSWLASRKWKDEYIVNPKQAAKIADPEAELKIKIRDLEGWIRCFGAGILERGTYRGFTAADLEGRKDELSALRGEA